MPYTTTIEQLEQIVEQTLAGTGTHKGLPSPAKPAPPVTDAGTITRTAAWGIVVLLLTVPLFAAIISKPNLLWITWAIVSVWAALDSRNIGVALSSAKRSAIGGRMLVLSLAALNLFTAVYAMVIPFVPLR